MLVTTWPPDGTAADTVPDGARVIGMLTGDLLCCTKGLCKVTVCSVPWVPTTEKITRKIEWISANIPWKKRNLLNKTVCNTMINSIKRLKLCKKWCKKCHRYVTMNLIDCKYSWEELSETAVLTGHECQKSRIPEIVMGCYCITQKKPIRHKKT